MKKILSVALSLMLALTLLGTVALAEATDFTGVWYTRIYGLEMAFSLNEGGLYTVSFDTTDEVEESEGTWEMASTGIVFDKGTADEVVLTYDAQADTLSGMISDMELVFTRELTAAIELDPARSDAVSEEYNGQWAATLLCLGEIQTTPQESQFELLMTVEDGLNCLTRIVAGEDITINITPEFSNGAMILNMDAADGSAYYVVVCQLLEDGSMSVAFPAEFFGQEAIFAMRKLEVEGM